MSLGSLILLVTLTDPQNYHDRLHRVKPMRIVVALGGNALLRRGEALTSENQRRNIQIAAAALAPLASDHQIIITHGNGPQVGLLALQSAAYKSDESYPLDILDAETEGMIGYLIEQELGNYLPPERLCATLLTQIEVDPHDPAFDSPTKPIGPVYSKTVAEQLANQHRWRIAKDGEYYRRVVPSPRPRRIVEIEVIKSLIIRNVVVICAGGGGIPVVKDVDGHWRGVEAVIDKDLAGALLAIELGADHFMMLTDVDAVYQNWGMPEARAVRCISPGAIREMAFAEGSMAPKMLAACEFVEKTGRIAGIGQLKDVADILAGTAGTTIAPDADIGWWD
ncbi:carbamate kinase [Methylomicrobium lacus]|uniref:carbamate kinase n=1 Tax=Methylomicrobium lacus TaxID=136992 RepID=UPI001FE1C489|nr:carbamate kinase [Methylomicrobium lacus]